MENKTLEKLLGAVVTVVGICVGLVVVLAVYEIIELFSGVDVYGTLEPWLNGIILVASGAVCGGIVFVNREKLIKKIRGGIERFTDKLSAMRPIDYIGAVAGLAIGLFIAYFISRPIALIPLVWLNIPVALIAYVVCVSICVRTMMKFAPKIQQNWQNGAKTLLRNREEAENSLVCAPKYLDTSAVIDGRIAGVLRTGVIEGRIVVPGCVLAEIRSVADSSDELKREKGRRGLDVLSELVRDMPDAVELGTMDEEGYSDTKFISEVSKNGGTVITGDYNLNKLAGIHGLKVINLNELSNALRPVLLPGEKMRLKVVREGKEHGQGVAYTEDGTMIVVENGKNHIGETVLAEVTSVLQTAAGRMIFARTCENN